MEPTQPLVSAGNGTGRSVYSYRYSRLSLGRWTLGGSGNPYNCTCILYFGDDINEVYELSER